MTTYNSAKEQIGFLHSVQSLGTVDGPGVRYVFFLQGCPLRCGCCHNPDTQPIEGGHPITVHQAHADVLRYRPYYGKEGGVTLSGGEPLLQIPFATALFARCKGSGISTCLDTSGCLWSEAVEDLLTHTDRVLLDIKYAKEALYRAHVGCSLSAPLLFLEHLERLQIPTTLRQVILPTLNDTEEGLEALGTLAQSHTCVDRVELLPFRKLCTVKYEALGRPFPFADLPEPTEAQMAQCQRLLRRHTSK